MRQALRRTGSVLSIVVFCHLADPRSGDAGSFSRVAVCSPNTGCLRGTPATQHPLCAPDCEIPPFAIVHAVGYTGSQSSLQVRICLNSNDSVLEPALLSAIDTWNSLTPIHENCYGCFFWETPQFPSAGKNFVLTTILHELGHCALALDHIDRLWDANGDGIYEPTSFTRSAGAASTPGSLSAGPDGVRGSRDDFHTAPGGGPADSVSWARTNDNDPFVIDGTVIDEDTYARSVFSLPPGHTWGASANRIVGELLGYQSSQSVMYSGAFLMQHFHGLAADDSNMVRMARAGLDFMAGTADDYTSTLVFVGDCGNAHEIRVERNPLTPGMLGACIAAVDYSFEPPNPFLARHFSRVSMIPPQPLLVLVSSDVDWDFSLPVFLDGFEGGDTSEWTATVP